MKWEFEIQNNWRGYVKLWLIKITVLLLNFVLLLPLAFIAFAWLFPFILMPAMVILWPDIAPKFLSLFFYCIGADIVFCLYGCWRIIKDWGKMPSPNFKKAT